MVDGQGILDTDTTLVIWNNTPWTIPAQVGIAVHPRFDYVQVTVGEHKYVVAAELLDRVAEEVGWETQ